MVIKNDTIFRRTGPVFIFLAITFYLFIGTGLHADDYSVIGSWSSWHDFLNIDPFKRGLMIFGLPSYFSFWWAYFLLGYEHQWVYDFDERL